MLIIIDHNFSATVVTEEKGKVTRFNEKVCRDVEDSVGDSGVREVRKLASQSFADPQRIIARIEEIVATNQETFGLLD